MNTKGFGNKFLVIYSGLLTVVFAVTVLSGFANKPKKVRFEEIDVERINVIEPDGKLDMVISNISKFPPPVTKGKILKRSGNPTPGMIFYNQDGDENGGLIFDGKRGPNGVSAGAGLMFDQFEQDQTVGMQYQEQDGRRMAGFLVWDHPDVQEDLSERAAAVNKMPDGPEKQAAKRELRKAWGSTRVFLGKMPDKSAGLALADPDGNPRVRISVDEKGTARIEFLDAQGKVSRQILSDEAK